MKQMKGMDIVRLLATVVIVVVLATVLIYQNRDRSLLQGSVEKILSLGVQKTEGSAKEGYAEAIAVSYGDYVAVASTNTFMMLNDRGKKVASDSLKMTTPVLREKGGYLVLYDEGGTTADVYRGKKKLYSVTTENKIDVARINRNGYLAVVTERLGYNGEITVYNAVGEALYKWQMGESAPVDVDISSDNKKLVLSAVAYDNDGMRATLSLLSLSSTDGGIVTEVPNEIFLRVEFNRDGSYLATGTEQVSYYNTDNECKWSHSYNGRKLLAAYTGNPDCIVLAMGALSSGLTGNVTDIEILNRLGEVTASTTIDGTLTTLSVTDRVIAAAAGKTVTVLDEAAEVTKTMEATSLVTEMAVFTGGKTAFVINAGSGDIIQ